MAQSLGGRIDGEDPTGRDRVLPLVIVRLRQDQELAGRELSAVVEAHGAGHEQGLADLDVAIEEGLSRPDALDGAALIPKHCMENPKTAPGRQHSLGRHPTHRGRVVPDFELGNGGDGGRVDVPVRQMPEEVVRRHHAESGQGLGPTLADSLQEFDRRVEPELGHGRVRAPGGPSRLSPPRPTPPRNDGHRTGRGRRDLPRGRGSESGPRVRDGGPRRRHPGRCRRAW